MKMLKKAAAVLLAAAMSLVMLTACGGGSGSSSLVAQALGDKYTIKYTRIESDGEAVSNSTTKTVMTDGTRFYEEHGEYATLETGDATYEINVAKKKAFKEENEEGGVKDTLASALVVTETGKKEYNGKTYTTETATFAMDGGKVSVAYYFYEGQMKYMVQTFTAPNGTSHTEVNRIDSIVKSVNESVLDIKNYEMVSSRNELYGIVVIG